MIQVENKATSWGIYQGQELQAHECRLPCVCRYNLIFSKTIFLRTNLMQIQTIRIGARLEPRETYPRKLQQMKIPKILETNQTGM